MLVQYLTVQSERDQHLMLSIVFFIFIVYSLYSVLYLSLFVAIALIILCIFGVYFYMKKQINNRTIIQPQVFFKTSKKKSLKRNASWVFVPFMIYSFLTIFHFIIVESSGSSILPLVYDYGIGGVLAFALSSYMNKNWSIGVCDDGLILGSKLDLKLVTWEHIVHVNYLPNSIEVELVKDHPLDTLSIFHPKDLSVIETLLKYKID